MAVTLVNCFEVPTGREDEFFSLWQEVNAYMWTQPGYLGHALYRAVSPDASFRFVNFVRWESAAHFRASHSDEFRKLVSRPEWASFTSKPGLYEVLHEGEAKLAAAE